MMDIFRYEEARNAIAAGVIGLLIGWRVARSLELKNPEREWTAVGTGAVAFATCGWIVPILFAIAVFLVPAYLAITAWVTYSLNREQNDLTDQNGPESSLKIASQTHPGDENAA